MALIDKIISGELLDEPGLIEDRADFGDYNVRRLTFEYWTSKQRQAHSLHEISYRSCFKPELPSFFIQSLSKPGEVICDPFSGRGTTIVEAALHGCYAISNDISPLSRILLEPRLNPPTQEQVEQRLEEIYSNDIKSEESDLDLSMFYHKKTLSEILHLKNYLKEKTDYVDNWIRMVATNRLTGHSKGFFSVYTMPPNQAISQKAQININRKRNQIPEYRDVKKIIIRKTHSLLRNITSNELKLLNNAYKDSSFYTMDARTISAIEDGSISLTVTSPPFLDTVQYDKDNWLRCWFNNITINNDICNIIAIKYLEDWQIVMGDVMKELFRITRNNGYVAFEVGEVRKRKVNLDEYIVPLGINAGFKCVAILVNKQNFTKTANCWGVRNNVDGTNTNRIVLFNKI